MVIDGNTAGRVKRFYIAVIHGNTAGKVKRVLRTASFVFWLADIYHVGKSRTAAAAHTERLLYHRPQAHSVQIGQGPDVKGQGQSK